jgi:methyl-accepting chemotaxis protein/methyl-accepting chemotaxis protein-1 (serine sensor receptor)
VSSVQRVTDIMGEISAASQEQSSGIEQVNQTVTQMDEATQQNAALVEQATAAARAMEEQAGQLSEAVAMFRLDHSVAVTTLPSRAAATKAAAKRPQIAGTAHTPAVRAPANRRTAANTAAEADWQEF